MGVWDETTPAGTDNAREGDDRLRELKVALGEALSHEDSTFPGASPGTTPIFIPGFLRGNTASRPTGDSLVNGRLYINTTLNIIERYNGSTWSEVSTLIPSGTKMLFLNSSVPTGWTQDVSFNGQVVRTASGVGGGTGGTTDPGDTITLNHSHTVDGHTHDLGNHTHTGPSHTHDITHSGWTFDGSTGSSGDILISENGSDPGSNTGFATVDRASGSAGTGATGTPSTNTSGSTSPGTDAQLTDLSLAYASAIVGTKD